MTAALKAAVASGVRNPVTRRYAAFVRADGGDAGGDMREFMLWVRAAWDAWDRARGRTPGIKPRDDAEQHAFDDWLEGRGT